MAGMNGSWLGALSVRSGLRTGAAHKRTKSSELPAIPFWTKKWTSAVPFHPRGLRVSRAVIHKARPSWSSFWGNLSLLFTMTRPPPSGFLLNIRTFFLAISWSTPTPPQASVDTLALSQCDECLECAWEDSGSSSYGRVISTLDRICLWVGWRLEIHIVILCLDYLAVLTGYYACAQHAIHKIIHIMHQPSASMHFL